MKQVFIWMIPINDERRVWESEIPLVSFTVSINGLLLVFPVLCISETCIEIKINLNFYFHTSLWCLEGFYEGLKGLYKTLWGTTKKCENKNLM